MLLSHDTGLKNIKQWLIRYLVFEESEQSDLSSWNPVAERKNWRYDILKMNRIAYCT